MFLPLPNTQHPSPATFLSTLSLLNQVLAHLPMLGEAKVLLAQTQLLLNTEHPELATNLLQQRLKEEPSDVGQLSCYL